MKCPRCQHENRAKAKYCEECATPLRAVSSGSPPSPSYTEVTTALSEALEQQTATSEILRVISRLPTDLQSVLDAMAERAARLCDSVDAAMFLVDGDALRRVAHHGPIPPTGATTPLVRGFVNGRVALERREIHLADLQAETDEFPEGSAEAQRVGWRTTLAVPLMRENTVLGTIAIRRTEIRAFSTQHIDLLKTFADQAVIAIENVRLFTETKEALEQQTATAEVLRVISSSPTDVQPVLDTVVESAVRLCGAYDARLWQLEGDRLVRAAAAGPLLEESAAWLPLDPELPSPRAFLERRTIHFDVPAIVAAHAEGFPALQRLGLKSGLATPLLREGKPIGVLAVRRQEATRFSDKHVELLQIFADQAVIAIENVRLFTELQEKNRALTQAHAQVTEALEQQTATSDILRVISRSPTDAQPVFDTIVESATRLCRGLFGALVRYDGALVDFVAHHNFPRVALDEVQRIWPTPPARTSGAGRAILERAVVQIPDIELDPEYGLQRLSRAVGHRSSVYVPMLRDGTPIGVIVVARAEPGRFPENEVELLKTFADQAVIAIENVRLFKELETQTAALTRSVDQLTALGEVGRAVSSTLDLETVLTTIVSRAVELSGLDGGVVFEYDEAAEEFVQRVATETGEALAEARRTTRIRKGEGVLGRTAITLEPVQVPAITAPGAYEGRLRQTLIASGIRAILAVPMVREGQLIGCLVVTRNRPGEFPAETIELLRTFATQSALAIQNARLFHEIEDKSRQLEAASQHKSEFLANMSHELRTPLNAIIGFSEVLGERLFGDLNEKQEEYLKDIHASGQHLLSLINDILDLSKIEAGRMELELTDFDLPTAIDNALTLVRERAGRRGIALHQAADEGVGQTRGDERKIKQVLLNLLSNAIKFTPDGGRIAVRARPVDGSVEVSVSDTGVGIAPEDQEAIFEEFRQVGTAAKKVEGTGLGLALSRKFVELHGGRIEVQSQLGVGSTFTFTIPRIGT